MKYFSLMAVLGLCLLSRVSVAGDALRDFSASMQSFSADFTQAVYDSDSVALQESSGRVQLMRPGKFRWAYDVPVKQLIVADGVTLWVYDEDIRQVTVQPQSAALGSAPIGLLSGERAIESEFNIIDLGVKDDLQWFELEPLVKDTDFNAVYIALDDAGLRAMELRDNFDQATQIRFSNFRKNVDIAATDLQFVPPAGADVVGEPGIAPDADVVSPDTLDSTANPLADLPDDIPAVDNPDSSDPLLSDPLLSDPLLYEPADALIEEAPGREALSLEASDVQPQGVEPPPLDDGPPLVETLPVNVIDPDGEITFEEIIIPAE